MTFNVFSGTLNPTQSINPTYVTLSVLLLKPQVSVTVTYGYGVSVVGVAGRPAGDAEKIKSS